MTRSPARPRRSALLVAAAAVAAAAACTLNPQPLPPVDLASNGSPDGGAFGAAADGGLPRSPLPDTSNGTDAGATTSAPTPDDGGGMPPVTVPGDAGDAGDLDAGDAGDAD